jgi:REP element-mobilizing transposase RayT
MYYHIIWATKNRLPLITPSIENQLYPYLVRKAAGLGAYVYAINGWNDHIHMIVAIPPKLAVAEFVKDLKGASAHEINLLHHQEDNFGWQRGYGVLSLGERQKATAEAYVNNQKVHHQAQTFHPWLERCPETDEGPDDPANHKSKMRPASSSSIKEEDAKYEVKTESPF